LHGFNLTISRVFHYSGLSFGNSSQEWRKPFAEKLREHYRNEKPFDPELNMESDRETAVSTEKAKEATNSDAKR